MTIELTDKEWAMLLNAAEIGNDEMWGITSRHYELLLKGLRKKFPPIDIFESRFSDPTPDSNVSDGNASPPLTSSDTNKTTEENK